MNLEFEDNQKKPLSQYQTDSQSGIVGFLIRKKIIKTKEKANVLLLIITITAIIVTIVLIFNFIKNNKTNTSVNYKFSKEFIKRLPPAIQTNILK